MALAKFLIKCYNIIDIYFKEVINVKKIFALTLALLLCISIVACGNNPSADDPGATSVSTTAATTAATTTSTTTLPVIGDPIVNPSDPNGASKPTLDVEGHCDENHDKKCDDCGISVVTTFDFYAINDLHGKFVSSGNVAGVEGLTTYMQTAAAADDNPIFLSSGDMWQGGAESNLTKGVIVTEWMNYLGFASMTLGNHEFDWGDDYIETNAEIANFPLLAINIYDKATNEQVDYCDSSVLIECRGLQVGIIGAIGDCYSSISGDKVGDFYFKTGSELTSLVKAEADALRSAGADLIVYSIHDGGTGSIGSYYDTALSNGYVDIVFEGHSHYSYVLRDGNGVYHLQNQGDNGGISHAEIEYNFANGEYSVTTAEHVRSSIYSQYDDSPIVAQLLEKHKNVIAKAREVLGTNSTVRDPDTMRQIIAQLYFEAGYERWGNQYDIVLGGGFMSAREPEYLHAGTVVYGDLQSIFPFDNELVLCSIKGRDLVSKFLETSNSNYFIYCGEYGNSIKNNVDYNATYYVITDTYSSSYKYNNLTEIARYDANVFARDLLAEYIKDGNFDEGSIGLTSIADILSIGSSLPANGTTSKSYCVRGEIVSVYNTIYGNMIIRDTEGNTLTVYGVSAADGTRYDGMTNPPRVGDVVIIQAPIKHYVNASTGEDIVELFQSFLVGAISGDGLTSISEIHEIGANVEPNAETVETYRVRGEIIEVYNPTYGNMIIRDGEGNTLTVYGVYDADGTRYDGMASAPQVGDLVILEAPIKHYVNVNNNEDIVELFHATVIEVA